MAEVLVYSSVPRRLISGLIDTAVVFSLLVLIFTIYLYYLANFTDIDTTKLTRLNPLKPDLEQFGEEFLQLFTITLFVWVFVSYSYFIIAEGLTGQTLGKWILGMKIYTVDLKPAGVWKSVVRNLGRAIDAQLFGLVGLTVMLMNKRKQRVGDIAAGTIVVNLKKEQ